MGRAKLKGPFINGLLKKKSNVIYLRNSVVVPKFIGKTFQIYNGKSFTKLKIVEEMVGHKLGEFSATRQVFAFKKKKKKK